MKNMKIDRVMQLIRNGGIDIRPLSLRAVESRRKGRFDRGDTPAVTIAWQGKRCRFAVEFRRDAKPRTLELAVLEATKKSGQTANCQPLVISPYFTREKLDDLLSRQVSAIDLCGNAAIESPGQFLFYRTGNPNQFPDSRPVRFPYRGDGSLVARVMLCQAEFSAIGDVLTAIRRRGGSLTMGTVSKVLMRLEEDLIVERPTRRSVRLLQREKLLDQLLDAYQPPKIDTSWTGQVALSLPELSAKLRRLAMKEDVVLTGESSAGVYATCAGDPVMTVYCRATPADLIRQLGANGNQTLSFPNLRLLETQDQRVYFDRRDMLTASPIQSWLEMASGDKRHQEIARQIQSFLMTQPGAVS